MDKNTYKEMLAEHRDRVFSYALYSLRDRDDAEDVTQEVFLRLWKQGADFAPDRAEAWLVRVTHNLCVDQGRRRRTVRARLGQADAGALERLADPATDWNDPERGLQRDQDRRQILDAVATLPAETRSIVLLHYFQGRPLQEIAADLGKNPSTVKVQIHRARKALRLVLTGREDAPPLAAKQETGS